MGREIISAPLGNPRAAGGPDMGRKKDGKKQYPYVVGKKNQKKNISVDICLNRTVS